MRNESRGPDPDFIPSEFFNEEGTPMRALADAFTAYAAVHKPDTEAEFLATEEGTRLKAEAYPND